MSFAVQKEEMVHVRTIRNIMDGWDLNSIQTDVAATLSEAFLIREGMDTLVTEVLLIRSDLDTMQTDLFLLRQAADTMQTDLARVLDVVSSTQSDVFLVRQAADTMQTDLARVLATAQATQSETFLIRQNTDTMTSEIQLLRVELDAQASDVFRAADTLETIASDIGVMRTELDTIQSDTFRVRQNLDWIADATDMTCVRAALDVEGVEVDLIAAPGVGNAIRVFKIHLSSYCQSNIVDGGAEIYVREGTGGPVFGHMYGWSVGPDTSTQPDQQTTFHDFGPGGWRLEENVALRQGINFGVNIGLNETTAWYRIESV